MVSQWFPFGKLIKNVVLMKIIITDVWSLCGTNLFQGLLVTEINSMYMVVEDLSLTFNKMVYADEHLQFEISERGLVAKSLYYKLLENEENKK